MSHGFPAPGPPPRSSTDLGVSIAALVLTVLVGAAAAVAGLFSLAFLDYCPPDTCSVDGAVNAVFTALAVAATVGVAGTALTIVALVRRRSAWPLAVGTLALCVVICVLGGVGYAAAVGA